MILSPTPLTVFKPDVYSDFVPYVQLSGYFSRFKALCIQQMAQKKKKNAHIKRKSVNLSVSSAARDESDS